MKEHDDLYSLFISSSKKNSAICIYRQNRCYYFSILQQHLCPFGQAICVLFEEVGYSFNNPSMTERSWGRSSLIAEKTTASSILAYS